MPSQSPLLHRPSSSLSPEAAVAYGDAMRAAVYDDLRPAYSPELLAEAIGRAPRGAGSLLDLGAGTGRLTRALMALPLSARGDSREVLAVEPVAAMRDAFVAEGVTCANGCGRSIPVEDGSCAAVFCGESFHWMATATTLREIYRVLCHDGILVLCWNTRDPHTSGFATQLENGVISPLYHSAVGARQPRQQQRGAWEQAFQEQSSSGLFNPAECVDCTSSTLKIEGSKLIDMVCGLSVVASKPQHEQAQLKRTMFQFLMDHSS